MTATSKEIQELIAETIEELSQLIEARHSEKMVEIDGNSEIILPMTDRISERYTTFHRFYFAETANVTTVE